MYFSCFMHLHVKLLAMVSVHWSSQLRIHWPAVAHQGIFPSYIRNAQNWTQALFGALPSWLFLGLLYAPFLSVSGEDKVFKVVFKVLQSFEHFTRNKPFWTQWDLRLSKHAEAYVFYVISLYTKVKFKKKNFKKLSGLSFWLHQL